MSFAKRTLALTLLAAIGFQGLGGTAVGNASLHVFHRENILGTSMELKLAAANASEAEAGEAAALVEIGRLSRILSTYDPGSEASRWMNTSGEPVRVSSELFGILSLFDTWRDLTRGALDPAAAVVGRLWKRAAEAQQVPSTSDVEQAVKTIRQPHWRLDASNQTATHLSSAPLALNSFVKSYIINRAANVALAAAHADAVVLNIGGDLVVRGNLEESVLITNPRDDAENAPPAARLKVRDRVVATSGGYRRGVEIAGRWYSHLVDPRTGQPVDHILSATVVAPDATDGGALATALCVLTPEEGLRLAASVPGAECLLLAANGQRFASRGWGEFEVAALGETTGPRAAQGTAPKTVLGPAWDTSMELNVSLELARLTDDRARRPYVAVWVEDKDKYPVRTLALWFKGDRWLPDLRAWYRGDQLRSLSEGKDITASVSSATRPAGKYTVKWDGKDNAGTFVKPGKYTVFIEAAREHGTYQLMRQEIDFNGAPAKFDLKGNTEIAAAAMDYRRKADGR